MLIIRREQYEVLRRARLTLFEQEMVEHLAQFSPPLFRAIKEPQMHTVVRFGMGRAAEHGFTFRGPVRLYLELMLLLGSHFDTDVQYPWAAEIMNDGSSQMARAERLCSKMMDYRQAVAGPDDAFTFRALRRLSALGQQLSLLPPARDELVNATIDIMKRTYPEKTEYVGDSGIAALAEQGCELGFSLGGRTGLTRALPAVLMFAFGGGCFVDPLYPWIGHTARGEIAPPGAMTDPEARMSALVRKATTWLDHVLASEDAPPVNLGTAG